MELVIADARPAPLVGVLPGMRRPPALRPGSLRPRARRPVGMSRTAMWAAVLAFVLAVAGTTATVVTAPPSAPAPPSVSCSTAAVAKLSDEQRRNAAAIVGAGKAVGVSQRGQIVALATALQESTLRNLDYGDRDSLGLFQQRPSMGWGTPAQVRDPVYAAKKFYAGLLKVPDWERLPVTVAAQRVQRSGFPQAYAKWEPVATALVTGTTCRRK